MTRKTSESHSREVEGLSRSRGGGEEEEAGGGASGGAAKEGGVGRGGGTTVRGVSCHSDSNISPKILKQFPMGTHLCSGSGRLRRSAHLSLAAC